MSDSIESLIQQAKDQGWRNLDLSESEIDELPATLFHLNALEGLKLPFLIKFIPPDIAKLKNLKSLNLLGTKLHDLPEEIGVLENLQSLDLSYTELVKLPREIGQLKNLESLDLSGTKLTELPPEIGLLQNLQSLDFSRSQLTELDSQIGQLKNLKSLELRELQLNKLPKEIGQLKDLELLDLRGTSFRTFPEIGQSELPAEIGDLQNLKEIDLTGSELHALPIEIGRLKRLEKLWLANNNLKRFPSMVLGLENLAEVSLDGNPIADLPPEYCSGWATLDGVRSHHADIRHGLVIDRELRLVVLGNCGVGKTSVLKRLVYEKFDDDEDTTHGIRLDVWKPTLTSGQARINIWDCGGRDVDFSVENSILENRSVFMIVWDAETETYDGMNRQLQIWLNHVKEISPGSSIVIVENKCDDGLGNLSSADLGGRPHITFSAKTGHGQKTLRALLQEIFEREFLKTGCYGIGVGRANVKETLRGLVGEEGGNSPNNSSDKAITHEEFARICENEGDKVSATDDLLWFLHNSGVLYACRNGIILDQRRVMEEICFPDKHRFDYQ